MRRSFLATLLALSALTACGAKPAAQGEAEQPLSAAEARFPDLFKTSVRLDATITEPDTGKTMPVVMMRDGRKLRMEMDSERGAVAVIMNSETGENVLIMGEGANRFAIRQPQDGAVSPPDLDWAGDVQNTARRVGDCSVAGEHGAEWERTDEDGKVNRGCLTADGVILSASVDGKTTWEAQKVTRGPQDPALFTVPANVNTLDVGAMSGQMLDALRERIGQ